VLQQPNPPTDSVTTTAIANNKNTAMIILHRNKTTVTPSGTGGNGAQLENQLPNGPSFKVRKVCTLCSRCLVCMSCMRDDFRAAERAWSCVLACREATFACARWMHVRNRSTISMPALWQKMRCFESGKPNDATSVSHLSARRHNAAAAAATAAVAAAAAATATAATARLLLLI
jgi:hypothetical protein